MTVIDIEADIIDKVYNALVGTVPDGSLTSEYVLNPPKFPHISLIEMSNVTDQRHQTQSNDERYAILSYEANIFAYDRDTCREIAKVLDASMRGMNFRCLAPGVQFIVNIEDPTIYRMNGRYEAVTDGQQIYRT